MSEEMKVCESCGGMVGPEGLSLELPEPEADETPKADDSEAKGAAFAKAVAARGGE